MAARPATARGAVVEQWIAAVPMQWNVVPNGRDAIGHRQYPPDQATFPAVAYRAFTPGFRRQLPLRGEVAQQRGIIGPLVRAQVGDDVVIHFRNLDRAHDHSMHFHGVEYAFDSDGSWIPGFSGPGSHVAPGHRFTYRLHAGTGSAGVWPYHDHGPDMMASIAGGMYGALSIRARGTAPPRREFVVFLEEAKGLHTINGRAFVGNTPVFHATVGDTVQFDVLALGDEEHVFHVHGHRWMTADGARDSQVLGPSDSFAVRWIEEVPGTWLYHCHVEGHMAGGMIGLYRVAPRRVRR